MVKKTLFVGAGLLLLIALFAGRDAVSYVSTTVGRVHAKVKSNVPVDFEIERARKMIKNLEPEIRDNMTRIAKEEVEVAKIEGDLDRQEKMLAKSRKDIFRLKNDIESGHSQFVYAGRSYSANQVKTDLANRFQHFRTAESTVEQMQKILRARQNCLNAAREKLEGTLAARRQLEVEVENLEARAKMLEVAQTTSEFNFDDSQLSRTRELINDINTRLEVGEKLINQDVQLHDRIPLDAEEVPSSEDVLDAVTKYFSESPELESYVDSDAL